MPLPPPGFPRISAKWQSSSVDIAGIEENWDEVDATRRTYGREDRIILEDFLDRDALLKATTELMTMEFKIIFLKNDLV